MAQRKTDVKWRCMYCDGTNVKMAEWIDPNTRVILDDAGGAPAPSFIENPSDVRGHALTLTWCNDCERHHGLVKRGPVVDVPPPECGHSACRQNWIEANENQCCELEDWEESKREQVASREECAIGDLIRWETSWPKVEQGPSNPTPRSHRLRRAWRPHNS